MSKLNFDAAGQRKYENGVDHCVLFVLASISAAGVASWGNGVAWNGITTITESPEGGDTNAMYADNIKYAEIASAEDFKATIEAYTYPDEFAECTGEKELVASSGVKIGQQDRKPFCVAYRTKIGNDLNPNAGYKLHIVYNCLAKPSEKAYETINDSPEGMSLSWEVSTTPMPITKEGYTNLKPTAHLVIDSTKVDAAKLTQIENALYGTDGEGQAAGIDPHLLTPDAIIDILKAN